MANRAGNTPVMFCKYIKEGGGIYLVTCHGYFDDGKIVHTCGGNQSAVGFALVTSRSAVGPESLIVVFSLNQSGYLQTLSYP